MVYLQHRSFLPLSDPLHNDKQNFPHKRDPRKQPGKKTMAYINAANRKYAAASTKKEKCKQIKRNGCKGTCVLQKLPYHDRFLDTPVKPMHLIKDISEHIVRLLAGVEDSIKVRREEQSRRRFSSSWPTDSTRNLLPAAPFTFSREELKTANNRSNCVRVPCMFDWRPRDLFSSRGMKSHEWKEVMCSGIIKFCIRGLLGTKQRSTLFKFCDVMSRLCCQQITENIDDLELETHQVLALMERDYPVSLHVIVFHLLHHLPFYLRQFGPVYGYWMYPFERFNSWISRRVLN